MKIYSSSSSEVMDIYFTKQASAASEIAMAIKKILPELDAFMVSIGKAGDQELAAKITKTLSTPGRAQSTEQLVGSLVEQGVPESQARTIVTKMITEGAASVSSAAITTAFDQIQTLMRQAQVSSAEITELGKAATEAKNTGQAVYRGETISAEKLSRKLSEKAAEAGRQKKTISELRTQIDALKESGQLSQQNWDTMASQLEGIAGHTSITAKSIEELGQTLGKQIVGVGEGVAQVAKLLDVHTQQMAKDLGDIKALMQKVPVLESSGKITAEQAAEIKEVLISKEKILSKEVAAGTEKAGKGSVEAAETVAEEVAEAEAEGAVKAQSFFDKLLSNPQGVTALAGVSGKALALAWGGAKIAAVLGVAGLGYYWWSHRDKDSGSDEVLSAKDQILKFQKQIETSRRSLSALSFRDGSAGKIATDALLADLDSTSMALPGLLTGNQKDSETAIANSGVLARDLESYLSNKDNIKNDLVSQNGWDQAITDLEGLQSSLDSTAAKLYGIKQAAEAGTITGERRTQDATSPSNRPEVPLTIYDQTVNISHLPPEFRSSAPRIIQNVLNSSLGMAFIDPENKWGGFISKSGDPKKDYLESLKYLFNNEIYSVNELRQFMREKMPRAGKARHSGWKDAIRYYRENPYRPQAKVPRASKNNDFDYFMKFSINKKPITLKMSDNYHSEYFKDIEKGLSDTYAKSYFTGLNSMYDQELGGRDADVGRLYRLHDETGSDLVANAHPKEVVVFESMGKGGLVENGLEQKQHMEDVALSTPSGNFRSRHAYVLNELVKLANQADQEGCIEASNLIDIVAEGLIASLNE